MLGSQPSKGTKFNLEETMSDEQKSAPVEKPAPPQKEVIPDVDIANAAVALEEAIMELVHYEPFYANLTLNMRREFTTKFPTLAVNVTDEVNLFINPYFFCHLSVAERAAVIKHECLHVVNNHFVRFRDLEPQIYENPEQRKVWERMGDMMDASVLNQAADYAINEFNPALPQEVAMFDKKGKMAVFPTTNEDGTPSADPMAGKPAKGRLLFVKDLKKKIPHILDQQSLEYYYEFLKQEQEKQKQKQQGGAGGKGQPQQGQGQGQPQPGSGGMTLDDHSAWHESDATEDAITDKVKEVVNKAVEQTGERAMGNMPGSLVQAINQLNHVPKDWRQDMQRFVARSMELLIESTRKRRNRRYGILFAGQKIIPKLTIGTIIDASGSVCDDEVTQFAAELGRIYKMDIKVKIIEHDARVNAIYDFNPKKEFKVHGRGGTSFKQAYEEMAKLEVDGIIHFTDCGCYDEGIKKPKVPVLWAITGGKQNVPPYKWGGKTYIEVKKRVRR